MNLIKFIDELKKKFHFRNGHKNPKLSSSRLSEIAKIVFIRKSKI